MDEVLGSSHVQSWESVYVWALIVSGDILFFVKTSRLSHTCQPDRSQMTEFFQPTTQVPADWESPGVVA